MFYLTAKVFLFLFTPSNLIALSFLASALMLALGVWPRSARRLLGAGALGLIICGFSPLGAWLSLPLEERFPRPPPPPDVAGIILLGGYEDTPIATARATITVNEAADRLLETVRLAKRYPKARIVITGAWATILPNALDSTAPIAKFMQEIAIAPARIVAENKSRNTYQNARFAKQKLKPTASETYLLVTSAYHMPRAMGAFRAQGFSIVAWPTDYRSTGWSDAAMPFRSFLQGLERTDLAIKEWIGLLAYRMTGRTHKLLPAP